MTSSQYKLWSNPSPTSKPWTFWLSGSLSSLMLKHCSLRFFPLLDSCLLQICNSAKNEMLISLL